MRGDGIPSLATEPPGQEAPPRTEFVFPPEAPPPRRAERRKLASRRTREGPEVCGPFVFPLFPAEPGLTVPSGAFRVGSPLCVLTWKDSSASPGLLDVEGLIPCNLPALRMETSRGSEGAGAGRAPLRPRGAGAAGPTSHWDVPALPHPRCEV